MNENQVTELNNEVVETVSKEVTMPTTGSVLIKVAAGLGVVAAIGGIVMFVRHRRNSKKVATYKVEEVENSEVIETTEE